MSTTTQNPKLTEDERKTAEQLMETYAQLALNKLTLVSTIANELKTYDDNMKIAEKELLVIGELHKSEFDENGNLELGKGYLHIGTSTVVVVKRTFDAKTFGKKFPKMFDLMKAFKIDPIRKAFLDAEMRKVISKFGLTVNSKKGEVEVLLHKKKE